MFKEPGHLSDEDILLVLDGESSRRLARSAQEHLAACWECRSRMGELEGTIEAFVSLHRRTLNRNQTRNYRILRGPLLCSGQGWLKQPPSDLRSRHRPYSDCLFLLALRLSLRRRVCGRVGKLASFQASSTASIHVGKSDRSGSQVNAGRHTAGQSWGCMLDAP